MGLLYIINTVDMEGRLIKQPEAYIQKKTWSRRFTYLFLSSNERILSERVRLDHGFRQSY